MFDVGFSELIVIGIVALVVFGPEDLPRVARMAGHLLGKFRRHVSEVKAEINREMELADLKRLHDEVQASALNIRETVGEQVRSLEDELRSPLRAVEPVVPVSPEPMPELPAQGSAPIDEPVVVELAADAAASPAGMPVYDENQLDLFGMPVPQSPKHKV